MPENRDHFFSEIKNTYINIFCIKLLKVIMAATQLFQCFSFPKQSFLLPSFISFIFPHPSIYLIIGYPFSIHQSSIHPLSIQPFTHSSTCSSINLPDIYLSSIIQPSSTKHPSNQALIHPLLISKENLSY